MSTRRVLASIAAASALAACAVGPRFVRPPPPTVDHYAGDTRPRRLDAADAAQTLVFGQAPEGTWWRRFNSPSLDALVAAGLKDSPTLESARAALEASHDQARAGAGVFFPQLSGSASGQREQYSAIRLGQATKPSTFNLFTVTGSVAYAIDVFGGERRNVEALLAARDRQQFAEGAAWLSLTGNIVDAAIARAGYAEEAAVLGEIVDLEATQRDSLRALYQGGAGALTDVLVAEQQLATDRQSLATMRQREAAAETLLKTLLGRESGEVTPDFPALSELSVPAEAPVSLPSQIVRRRPDILQAEAALHQASAQVGVATAALFPSINVTGDYGANSLSLGKLGSPQGLFWGIGPSVNAPVFDGGVLWFARKAALADFRAARTNYRQVVLAALEQTSDSIRALDADAEVVAASRAALDAASTNDVLSRTNRSAGVLSAADATAQQIAADRARLVYVGAQSQRLQDVVALYLASGGGWGGPAGQAGAPTGAAK